MNDWIGIADGLATVLRPIEGRKTGLGRWFVCGCFRVLPLDRAPGEAPFALSCLHCRREFHGWRTREGEELFAEEVGEGCEDYAAIGRCAV